MSPYRKPTTERPVLMSDTEDYRTCRNYTVAAVSVAVFVAMCATYSCTHSDNTKAARDHETTLQHQAQEAVTNAARDRAMYEAMMHQCEADKAKAAK